MLPKLFSVALDLTSADPFARRRLPNGIAPPQRSRYGDTPLCHNLLDVLERVSSHVHIHQDDSTVTQKHFCKGQIWFRALLGFVWVQIFFVGLLHFLRSSSPTFMAPAAYAARQRTRHGEPDGLLSAPRTKSKHAAIKHALEESHALIQADLWVSTAGMMRVGTSTSYNRSKIHHSQSTPPGSQNLNLSSFGKGFLMWILEFAFFWLDLHLATGFRAFDSSSSWLWGL